MNLRRFVAVSATLLLFAAPAFAQPAPSATTTAALTPPPALSGTTGLTDSSRSPIGFIPPTPDKIKEYIDAVGGVSVNASFHADKAESLAGGKLRLKDGADISLEASYSKKNGEPSASLDGITITAKGVGVGPHLGPLGINFQKAVVHADGSIDVKLNSWIPTYHIKKIVKQKNGDLQLKGSWWGPTIIVTKSGDVRVGKQVNVFGKKIGPMKTVGHMDPKILENWPPTFDDLADLMPKPAAASSATAAVSSASTAPVASGARPLGAVSQLAGTLEWDVKANADGLPVTVDGAPLRAKESLEVKGGAHLANGEIASIGSDNTVHLRVDFEKQAYGDAKNGFVMGDGGAEVDGAYRMEIPLADAAHKAIVQFDGQASYSGTGTDIHLTLPNGGAVSIGQIDVSRQGALHFDMNGDSKKFVMDDAHYAFFAKGPIHIEKLGPISSLDVDGQLSSQGLAKIRADGLLALQGDLKVDMQTRTAGLLALYDAKLNNSVTSTLAPGSSIHVNLDQVTGAVKLPLDGGKMEFEGADARGTASVHGAFTNNDIREDGVEVKAPSATADLSASGDFKVRGTDVSGEGVIHAGLALPSGATVSVAKPNVSATTTIDPNAHIDLDATVTRGGARATPALPELAVTTPSAGLNARSHPSFSAPVVKVLPAATPLTIITRQGDWARAKAQDGSTFWVNTPYLRTTRPATPAGTTSGPAVIHGKLTGELGATDATVHAFGANGVVKDQLDATLDAPFGAKVAPDGKITIDPTQTHATLPLRIDLKKGTQVTFSGQTITITDDLCYVQFTGDFALDASGKPMIRDARNVDILMDLGGASGTLFGKSFSLPSLGKTHFTGNVTFGPHGMTIHGDNKVVLGGQPAPVFNITF